MASTTLTSNSTAAVALTGTFDTLAIAAGASLVTNEDSVAIPGQLSQRDVLVDGRIVSRGDDGIELGSVSLTSSFPSLLSDIMITAQGGILARDTAITGLALFMELLNAGSLIGGASGVSVTGTDNGIINYGDIIGGSFGVVLSGNSGNITNSGEISGVRGGVSMSGSSLLITNAGLISSPLGEAVAMSGIAGASARIVNSGTIQGSINETLGNTTLTNTGVITGDIDLGAGNDTLRLLSGSVTGEIKAGDGDDLLILGPGEFDVSGGAGTDTLSAARNTVLGLDIEKLILRGGDDLRGTGNSDANTLTGNRGDNTLKGLGGRDILNGGRGDDILIGGSATDAVRDTFVFNLDCGADRIRGYQINGAGDDRIHLRSFVENGVFDDFADLKANFMRQSGEDVIIDLSGDDQVTIEKVSLANFKENDFIL